MHRATNALPPLYPTPLPVIFFTTDNDTTSYGKGLKGAVREHGPNAPMIIYGPGIVKARGEADDLVSLADIPMAVTVAN